MIYAIENFPDYLLQKLNKTTRYPSQSKDRVQRRSWERVGVTCSQEQWIGSNIFKGRYRNFHKIKVIHKLTDIDKHMHLRPDVVVIGLDPRASRSASSVCFAAPSSRFGVRTSPRFTYDLKISSRHRFRVSKIALKTSKCAKTTTVPF